MSELEECIKAELTALELTIKRLRELLEIYGEGTGPVPAPLVWGEGIGPKGSYEWITERKDLELAKRLEKGHLVKDGYQYWLDGETGCIFRRKREPAEKASQSE